MALRIFTLEQLKEFDGSPGKPAYIAFRGNVYDVSSSKLWKDGYHQGIHFAGSNLTSDVDSAPHDEDVLKGFPIVGELQETKDAV